MDSCALAEASKLTYLLCFVISAKNFASSSSVCLAALNIEMRMVNIIAYIVIPIIQYIIFFLRWLHQAMFVKRKMLVISDDNVVNNVYFKHCHRHANITRDSDVIF